MTFDATRPLTIADASRLLARRRVSSVELTRFCLARIARLDSRLGSFITVDEEGALRAARRADRERARGATRGPLHGIPLGIKDTVDTAGLRTTFNSRTQARNVPDRDATVVRRLREAGAVILGKLNTWEFGIGDSPDMLHPAPRNPWGLDRETAGSSSGSAVAVAAGLCLGAIGTDAGGSIRWPAALCGIVGLKPTHGLVKRDGSWGLSTTLGHTGPMTWTSEDCAILLQPIAGAAGEQLPDYRRELARRVRGLRVGVIRRFFEVDSPASTEVRRAVTQALSIFRDLGVRAADIRLSPLRDYNGTGIVIARPEYFSVHEEGLQRNGRLYSSAARLRMTIGGVIRAVDYIRAQQRRTELIAEIDQALERFDVLLTPGAAAPAPKRGSVGRWFNFKRPLYTMAFNVTGHPAMTFCCGFSRDGLPLSLQLIGRYRDESTLLRLAHAYEAATPWRMQRPPDDSANL